MFALRFACVNLFTYFGFGVIGFDLLVLIKVLLVYWLDVLIV